VPTRIAEVQLVCVLAAITTHDVPLNDDTDPSSGFNSLSNDVRIKK
jgi:hypothetical protein